MKAMLKCTFVAITALTLAACGSSSNKRNRAHSVTSSATSTKTVDGFTNAGWEKFSQARYFCKSSANGCMTESHPDYWSAHIGTSSATAIIMPMAREEAYKEFARCLLTAKGGYNPGDLNASFSNSGLSDSEIERKANACCTDNSIMYSMYAGSSPASPAHHDTAFTTEGLSTGEALLNYASKHINMAYCSDPSPPVAPVL